MLPGQGAWLDRHKLDMLSFLPNGIFFTSLQQKGGGGAGRRLPLPHIHGPTHKVQGFMVEVTCVAVHFFFFSKQKHVPQHALKIVVSQQLLSAKMILTSVKDGG